MIFNTHINTYTTDKFWTTPPHPLFFGIKFLYKNIFKLIIYLIPYKKILKRF